MYKQVLRIDDRNIWAVNGIGAVLAHRGHIREARELFGQVREAISDFKDVWMNLAHIYVEQKQYISAVQMYQNAMMKFNTQSDPESLTYLARALFKADKLKEAKAQLIKARHVAPNDSVVLYNLALVMQQLAQRQLVDSKSTLREVLNSIRDLELSQKYFNWLKDNGDRIRFDLKGAGKEEQMCKDILAQATQVDLYSRLNFNYFISILFV